MLHCDAFAMHFVSAAFYAVAFLDRFAFVCILDLLHLRNVAFRLNFYAFRGGAFETSTVLTNAFSTYYILMHSHKFLTDYILSVLQIYAFGCIPERVTF